ncbi:MAG: cytochrome c [Desulfobulbaceae bacterium]|nr:cytochrome c [Desulfobulbaceae bacterium]
MNRICFALFCCLIIPAFAGCGSPRRGVPIAAPVGLDSEQLVRGQHAFNKHCTQCHPGGEAGLGPALNNKPLPGFLIKLQVRYGFGAMPKFSEEHLDKQELDDLIAYLKKLRKSG